MPAPAKKTPAAAGNRHQRRAAASRKGAVSPFAAAMGLEAPKESDEEKAARYAEEDERKEGESDEDWEARKAKNAAEREKNETDASEEDDENEAETDEEKKEAAAFAEGFKAGGQRWAETLSAKEAKNKGLIACHLLSTTTMSSADIRASLAVMPEDAKASGSPLDRRMSAESPVPPAPNNAPKTHGENGMLTAAAITSAAAMVRGETPATPR